MWLLPAILAAIGVALYFAFFADRFDPTIQTCRDQVEAMMGDAMPTAALVALQLVQAVLLAPPSTLSLPSAKSSAGAAIGNRS